MRTTLSTPAILASLRAANGAFNARMPGDSPDRQPVHTVYGGAQIFTADTAAKLGATARAVFGEYAPTPAVFAKALGVGGSPAFHRLLHRRVAAKLAAEPVEDFRIDFEDGYGNRPDAEEDGHAASAARAMARGLAANTLPPFIGIRIKPFTEELKARSVRTLDIFLTALLDETRGVVPPNFVVTLPKITVPEQVAALAGFLAQMEASFRLPAGALKLELMVETPQSIFGPNGEAALPALVAAADGRCAAAHFGVYDYTASMNITAAHQTMTHPACDFARHVMKTALAGTEVRISDGATNVMPVGPHRPGKKPLTAAQKKENAAVVHRAWRLNCEHVTHSLVNGWYQGWDLHPAQLPVRYGAVYAFFLGGLDAASLRLRTFMEKAARATLIGEVFDDAATGQGLLNYFLRGINCGAVTETEATATGLTLDEIRTRSFVRILDGRRRRQEAS